MNTSSHYGKRLERLVARIAAQALAEYAEPVYRPALRRHLPDLAIADPKLPIGKGRASVRLLQSDLDFWMVDDLLTDKRPKHQKRNLPTDHPRYDTLKQRLTQWLDAAIERESQKPGKWQNWSDVINMITTMERLGQAPTEQQRQVIQQGTRQEAEKNLDYAIYLISSLINDPLRRGEYWVEVNDIVARIKPHGLMPTREQQMVMQPGIQARLDSTIEKARKSGKWWDWYVASEILNVMEQLEIPPVEQMRGSITQALVSAIDRALVPAIEQSCVTKSWKDWEKIYSDLVTISRIGVKPTQEQQQAMQQGIQQILNHGTKKRRHPLNGWFSYLKSIDVSSVIYQVGLMPGFRWRPAMTLQEVEEELHKEGAEFAEVPPLSPS